jgi:iron complex transport system ATP-binding protein
MDLTNLDVDHCPQSYVQGSMPLLEIRNLSLDKRLDDISFQLKAGEILGLIGPNGAGKSTLLQCLAGVIKGHGHMLMNGKHLKDLRPRERARLIGWLPQTQSCTWDLCVRDATALGRLPWGDRDSVNGREAVIQAMTQTSIETLAMRSINTLSGGERSRVWLARALAGQPQILLADEPLASLDLKHQWVALQILRDYVGTSRAVVLAIHDLGLAARWCDRLCLLESGRVRAIGAAHQVLTQELLAQVFDTPIYVNLDARPPIVTLSD